MGRSRSTHWAAACFCGICGGKTASSASRRGHLIGGHVDRYKVEVVDEQEKDALGRKGLSLALGFRALSS